MDNRLKDTIAKHFNEIIENFNLRLEDKSKLWPHIHLYNRRCIIRFIDDYGRIEASFVNPIEKAEKEKNKRADGFPSGYPVYPVFAVWELLYPSDKVNFRTISQDIDDQVLAVKKLLEERLTNVLEGDFTWVTSYR